MFGGTGYTSSGNNLKLNDLWRYHAGNNQWTWVKGNNTADDALAVYGTKGVAAAGNTPGGREDAVTWIDKNGNLWLLLKLPLQA